ncbi:MAG: HlyD family efflux transporter periplasmic adaptor subunit [Velocimicrobium sp.]
MARQNRKVVRYHKPFHINIGVIVFFIIFIYMVVISIHYFTQTSISIYEVVEKSISDDNTYKGIILRNETIYSTNKAGYVNYYIGDGEKVAKGSTVYTIDETGEIYKVLSNADTNNTLSKEDSAKVRNAISSFHKEYNGSNYYTVSDFKYDVENTILEQSSASLLSNLKDLVSASDRGSFDLISSKKSGIVSYTMDGYEDLKVGDITTDNFKNMDEDREQLRTSKAVAADSPIYKMINSEDWNIIIPLSNSQYKKMKDLDKVKITLKKEHVSVIAGISTYENGDSFFANLSLNKYMIRYINERYLDLEVQINAAEGLKIPITSILKKKFLIVPNEYIQVGGKTNTTGVTKEVFNETSGASEYEFLPVTVISSNDTDSYIEGDSISANDYIISTNGNKQYQLGKTRTLEGVYNVNKGYAVFRVIDKIYENKEYAIVSKDTSYGLSTYDHIVVNAKNIEESDLIK